MIESIPKPDAGLPEFLAARARHASDTRLVLDATGGFTVAVSAVLWGGPGWHLLISAGACFFAFGLWGIADRELGERGERGGAGPRIALRLLQAARVVSCVIGAAGLAVLLLSFLGLALGRLIS